MIEIEDLNITMKKHHILKDINISVPDGSICGFVGNNGCGKTVLFKCILGFYYPESGSIIIDGKMRTKKDGILKEAGALIEHPAFLEKYSGLQNLRYLYELNHKKNIEYLKSIITKVGLNPDDKKPVGKYSLGMKQRLGIAQVIMEGSRIMIFDEPMNGLDRNGVDDIRNLILDLKKQGVTILLASHNKQDIEILCDYVYELDDGMILPDPHGRPL